MSAAVCDGATSYKCHTGEVHGLQDDFMKATKRGRASDGASITGALPTVHGQSVPSCRVSIMSPAG